MPTSKTKYLKVFLLDFRDVPAPSGYSTSFVNELLFGSNPPDRSPAPDRSNFAGSAHQYFHASSDFWFNLKGEVVNWAHSSLRNRDLPHNHGSMVKPSETTEATDYGESWPVIVAETLRAHGFTSDNYSSTSELQDAILELSNGRKADGLVFLNADVAGGGAKRDFDTLRRRLDIMSHDRVRYNKIPGSTRKWNTLWDAGWSGLPDMLITCLLTAKTPNDRRRNNGTYNISDASTNPLSLYPLSVIWHEIAHLAVDVTRWRETGAHHLPDFYSKSPRYGPWGNACLMGGPSKTHYPMPLSSFARWMAGWMEYRDYSRADQVLQLRPFESHNDAVRIVNGAPGSNHFICFTNRHALKYEEYSTPPISEGRKILGYRLDLGGLRLRVERYDKVIRKISSVIRRSSDRGLYWGEEDSIDALPPTSGGIFEGPRTLRNERGELWWTLDKISATQQDDLKINLKLHALHLLEDFHQAKWTGEAPRRSAINLELDAYQGPDGHVALQDRRMLVAGRGGKALYLHPRWEEDGSIKGVYDISQMQEGPKRLYIKLGMPDRSTGSNGTRVSLTSGSDTYDLKLNTGDYRELVIDFREPSDTLTIVAKTNGSAHRDWVYIMDGWLVPAAPRIYDFLTNASSATWRSNKGRLTFNRRGHEDGEVSLRGWMHVHTGVTHGTKILFTHPDWNDDGWVEGTYPIIRIPNSGGMLRAHLSWAKGRSVIREGVIISIKMRIDGTETVLLDKAEYLQYPRYSSSAKEKNQPMFIELPVPSSANGKNAQFIFIVDAGASSDQDWLVWTELSLTSA